MTVLRVYLTGLFVAAGLSALAQEHSHSPATATKPAPPKVFLDKSPRVVAYQLKRLDNQRLLLVERKADDAKYIPVYSAILSRVGMSPQFLQEAADALAKLKESSRVAVLLEGLQAFDGRDRDQRRAARQLIAILLREPPPSLQADREALDATIGGDHALSRSAAFAALVVAGQRESALQQAQASEATLLDWLASVALIPDAPQRVALRDAVTKQIAASESLDVKRAAVQALSFIPAQQAETFQLVAPFVRDARLRAQAVRTLLKVPTADRDPAVSGRLVQVLVEHAEQTPAKDRTSSDFIDAMQLADQLLAKVASSEARAYRTRLSAVTVRVVRIKTVEEEMRYDLPYFAVEAGRPVQLILENHDLMPHNLVITTPGALKEVAQLGLQAGPHGGWNGLPYVPQSKLVLQASEMVPADGQTRLTFDAPQEAGEYPYVCTFPQHWYRMYGVMVVVEDLDAWQKNPSQPANPIGSNRSFVRSWKVDDLKAELESGLRGRSPEIGAKLFAEASCAGCHQVNGKGGVIGPELGDVFKRWKGDDEGVLREILDPSHKVDAKYAMQRVLTADGRTLTGVLVKEDDDNVTLMSNPEAKEPLVIPQDEIEAMVPSSVSIMPKALLDQYTKDEIFEILAYLKSIK